MNKINKKWWIKISGWDKMIDSFKTACIELFLKNLDKTN